MPVRLRPLSRDESDALVAGSGAPPVGFAWDADYPTEDTFIALGLLRLAHAAAGIEIGRRPTWWLHQIVVADQNPAGTGEDLIVGDIGFHGPPTPGSPAVVEIGYHVVPGWRGRGVATAACGLVLTYAWGHGAEVVRADAEGVASQAVLRRSGFRPLGGTWFEAVAP